MNIYWGDIHNHCGITYGFGSLENALKAAREQLDFCAIIGHAMWPDIPEATTPRLKTLVEYHQNGFKKLRQNWETVRQTVQDAHVPNEFVTFQGYEMHSRKYGDYHLLSPSDKPSRRFPVDAARGGWTYRTLLQGRVTMETGQQPVFRKPIFYGWVVVAVAFVTMAVAIGDIARVWAHANEEGVDFNLVGIPSDHPEAEAATFSPADMRRLFELGRAMAGAPEPWRKEPPSWIQ